MATFSEGVAVLHNVVRAAEALSNFLILSERKQGLWSGKGKRLHSITSMHPSRLPFTPWPLLHNFWMASVVELTLHRRKVEIPIV